MGLDPRKKAFSLLEEFRAFALKGNVIDLAVAVVIGTAFGAIVGSLVKDVIMPLIGAVLPGQGGYQGWVITLNGSQILIGKFLGEIVNFIIVALALFLFVVKFLGFVMRMRKKEAEAVVIAPPPPAPPTKEELLLTEIRDLLKATNG